jgi:hypothetical protein
MKMLVPLVLLPDDDGVRPRVQNSMVSHLVTPPDGLSRPLVMMTRVVGVRMMERRRRRKGWTVQERPLSTYFSMMVMD